jgi:hypothetical protein
MIAQGTSAGPLIALRIIGGVAAVALLIGSSRRYGKRNISRLNLIITGLLATAVVMLAIAPNLFNPVFDLFNLNKGQPGQRLIGVLLVANIVFFFLLVRNMSYADQATGAIRQLVEALTVQSFDMAQSELLPAPPRIVVIMPAHNEAENVGGVIDAMPKEVDGYPVVVVVVDDGSDDDTSPVVRKAGAMAARLPIRRGGGLALRVGYDIALKLDATVVVSMDADGQHVPDELPLLVKPILEGDVDLVNGSRVLGAFQRESLVRHLGVHFFSWLVTILIGTRITDVSNGYRATRADVLKRMQLDQDQFWASELLIEGMRMRLRIREVPITIRARAGGVSKKPKNLKYAWNFMKAIVKTWLR